MAKRVQLEIGQEWAFNRSRQASIGDYGFEKVIIKDVVPYSAGRWGYDIRKSGGGQGVLVSKNNRYHGEDNWRDSVVQLSQLFKPWSEFEVENEAYQAQKKINEAAWAIKKAENEKFRQEVYVPALKEFIDAVQGVSGKRLSSYDEIGKLPIEVLQAVAQAIKVQQVA
jgi:hypothetical protein